MPTLVEIVDEKEIRAFAQGTLDSERHEVVQKAIRKDPAAFTVYVNEFKELENSEEDPMDENFQVQVKNSEAKQGDSSWLSAKLLGASFMFIASFGVVAFAALNFGV